MTTTLKAQRTQAAFEMGQRDYLEARDMCIPVWFTLREESAYRDGYEHETQTESTTEQE